MMRMILAAAFLMTLFGTAVAEPVSALKVRLRLADATVDACLANCANTNASCKRVCPTTLSTPCLITCDSQAQTCRQSCQPPR
jgi:hypothetical protein